MLCPIEWKGCCKVATRSKLARHTGAKNLAQLHTFKEHAATLLIAHRFPSNVLRAEEVERQAPRTNRYREEPLFLCSASNAHASSTLRGLRRAKLVVALVCWMCFSVWLFCFWCRPAKLRQSRVNKLADRSVSVLLAICILCSNTPTSRPENIKPTI